MEPIQVYREIRPEGYRLVLVRDPNRFLQDPAQHRQKWHHRTRNTKRVNGITVHPHMTTIQTKKQRSGHPPLNHETPRSVHCKENKKQFPAPPFKRTITHSLKRCELNGIQTPMCRYSRPREQASQALESDGQTKQTEWERSQSPPKSSLAHVKTGIATGDDHPSVHPPIYPSVPVRQQGPCTPKLKIEDVRHTYAQTPQPHPIPTLRNRGINYSHKKSAKRLPWSYPLQPSSYRTPAAMHHLT